MIENQPCPSNPVDRDPALGIHPWNRWIAWVAIAASCAGAVGLGEFAGQWDLDSTRSDRIDQAIEACIADYPAQAKASTRTRLQETNTLTRKMFFTPLEGGAKVRIGYDDPSDGTPALVDGTDVLTTNSAGEEFLMGVTLDSAGLVEVFQASNGRRTNTYTLSSDGGTLHMQVLVESPEMPTDLTYRLAYARADLSGVSRKTDARIVPGAGGRLLHSPDGRSSVRSIQEAVRWRHKSTECNF